MGTNNPKVSAYVPELLKERLTQFRKERGVSESQAVTIILAEYFEIPEALGRSPEAGTIGGVTLVRMEALEERLTNFTVSVDHRLQQLGEEIRKISELSVVHQVMPDEIVSEGEQSSSPLSEPQVVGEVIEKPDEPSSQNGGEGDNLEAPQEVDSNSLPSELLNEVRQEAEEQGESDTGNFEQVLIQEVGLNPQVNGDSQNIKDNSSSLNEPLDTNKSRPQLNLSGEPLNSSLSKPLSGKIIAKRLDYHPDSLSKVKSKATDEEFLSLSIERDPDDIAWKFVKKGRGYLPASELSSELQDRLLNWLKKNFPEYSP